MKRCPECEFLYEDDQECCDMDGTVLRFTSFLPPSAPPKPAKKDRKPIWRGLAIPLLILVVIGSVLATLYRATPTQSSSSPATTNQPAANQIEKLPVSDNPQLVTGPAGPAKPTKPSLMPATSSRDPFASPHQPRPSTNEKRLSIEPETRLQMEPSRPVNNAPKPAPSQTSPPAPRQNTNAVRPEPPPVKPTQQPKTPNQDKDSKVKSLFKKAGRILKKPF